MATTELARSPEPPEATPPWWERAAGGLRLPVSVRIGDSAPAAILAWVLSRTLALTLLALFEQTVSGDVAYYARQLHPLFAGGSVRDVLQEYPLPVLGIMLPQYVIAGTNSVVFAALFCLSMLAADAAFTGMIWRHGGRRRTGALTFWLWFVPLIGPMSYFRFDLVTAVLAGGAVLVAARRPAVAGALTAIGAALKLWPAVLLPIFLIRPGVRRRVSVTFALVLVGIVAVSFAICGWDRLVSPIRWQAARGLQIESVAATPLMLAHAVHPGSPWHVHVSQYKAYEIFGSGVGSTLAISNVASVAGLLLLGWLWLRAYRHHDTRPDTLGWLFLATAAIVTVTSKTLSPQYVLWLGGPLAALMLFTPGDPAVRRTARLLLVVAVVTQFEYPIMYQHLENVTSMTFLATLVLTLRNVLLLRFVWLACAETWRRTRTA